jgi:hypothetical protein
MTRFSFSSFGNKEEEKKEKEKEVRLKCIITTL